VTLDWHEKLKILKLSFPVDVTAPRATYEVPYGHIERATNGDEDPGQRWIDVAGTGYGFSLINDAKYGYSVDGNDLRLSVVRGAAYAHHIPHVLDPGKDHLWQDQGVQTMRLLLVPHQDTWQDARVPRLADEFTVPAPVIYQGIHAGARPESDSFVSVSAPDVIVSAFKKAEEGDDLILRCYETDGRPSSAKISMRVPKAEWSGQFRPLEIKTLRVNLKTGRVREVNALEQ
jgi:alpha-mannosidase